VGIHNPNPNFDNRKKGRNGKREGNDKGVDYQMDLPLSRAFLPVREHIRHKAALLLGKQKKDS